MKINARLLLITFFIVVFITVTSTLVYYSITVSFLRTHYTNIILKSTRNFGYNLESEFQNLSDEYNKIAKASLNEKQNLKKIDFILEINNSKIIRKQFSDKLNDSTYANIESLDSLVTLHPNLLLFSAEGENGNEIYFGKVLNQDFINKLASNIDANVAFFFNGLPLIQSFDEGQGAQTFNLIEAYNFLRYKNNYDFFEKELENSDFWAAKFSFVSKNSLSNITFLVYVKSSERAEFTKTLQIFISIILVTGIALSLILVLLFTTKLRKQISLLSKAAKQVANGEKTANIPILSKDEIGTLSVAFNNMISELTKKEKQEKEYSDFLALINKNPELEEISEVALKKIVNSCNLLFGTLSIVDGNQMRFVSTVGIKEEFTKDSNKVNFYQEAIKNGKPSEFIFTENHPTIKTGLTEIKIEYLLIVPIIYNNETIAIIELASQTLPENDIKKYIATIHNELAVGLVNAKALEQLENLVSELQNLNLEYKKQNEQITSQNKELLDLHRVIKDKADELEVQKVKAEELTKVKSQFLASMSHELRTPLNSILGLTELVVNDKNTNPKMAERLLVVLRNGNKLLTLINNILEFSKAESGKISITIKEFILSEFVDDLINFASPLAKEKNLSLNISILNNKDFILKTDKTKIDQILTNLIGNAIKFTETGFVNVDFTTTNDSELLIKVSDSGCGISANNLPNIFDEFNQGDNSTSRQHGGTGLGLAICKRYVKMLEGSIEVESTIEQGTTFTIKLPNTIIKTLAVTPKTYENLLIKSEDSSAKILLVTQKKEIDKIFSEYFNANGITIKQASSKEEILSSELDKVTSIIIAGAIEGISKFELANFFAENNFSSNIFITNFDLQKEKAYTLLVDNFYNSQVDSAKIIEQIKSASKPFIISLDNSLCENIRMDLGIELNFYPDTISALRKLDSEVDLIVLEFGNSIEEEINFVSYIREKDVFKNIKLIVIPPKFVSEPQELEIANAFNKLTFGKNFHYLDVLKIIRDITLQSVSSKDINSNTSSVENDQSILIVDDDDDTLFTVGEIIEELGYKTAFAKNGVECLISLNNQIPDLVLLDIMMPQMDGFETIKRIRNNENFGKLPVFALTAHAMLDNKSIIEKNGFTGLITKPVNKAELAFKLKNALAKTY